MIGNVEVSVFLPAEYFAKVEALCDQHGWTHGELLMVLVDKPPPIEPRTSPPPKTKRADSPCRFTATVDAYYRRELEYMSTVRSLSRRDMLISLLDHYTTQRQKEIHNG